MTDNFVTDNLETENLVTDNVVSDNLVAKYDEKRSDEVTMLQTVNLCALTTVSTFSLYKIIKMFFLALPPIIKP